MSDFDDVATPPAMTETPDSADETAPIAAPIDTSAEADQDAEALEADDADLTAEADDDAGDADQGADELPEGIPADVELAEVTDDLDDVEKVLSQLDKENPELDELCATAEADGTLATRPALDAFWKVKSRRDG